MSATRKLATPPSAAATESTLLDRVVERTPLVPAKCDGIIIGSLTALDAGMAYVAIPAFGIDRVAARSLVALDDGMIGKELALGFEAGDTNRPIVLGPLLASAQRPVEAIVDGERLMLSAEREIELRCGESAIVLTADGRITLRGTYITSHASATQRILGGSVGIN